MIGPLSICQACTRYNENAGTCTAFPQGVPSEITVGLYDHRHPFPGDNGVLFDLFPPWEPILESFDIATSHVIQKFNSHHDERGRFAPQDRTKIAETDEWAVPVDDTYDRDNSPEFVPDYSKPSDPFYGPLNAEGMTNVEWTKKVYLPWMDKRMKWLEQERIRAHSRQKVKGYDPGIFGDVPRMGQVEAEGDAPPTTSTGQVPLSYFPTVPGWKRTKGPKPSARAYAMSININYDALNSEQRKIVRAAMPQKPPLVYKATIHGRDYEVSFNDAMDPNDEMTTIPKIELVMHTVDQLANRYPVPPEAFLREKTATGMSDNVVRISLGANPTEAKGAYGYTVRGWGKINIPPEGYSEGMESVREIDGNTTFSPKSPMQPTFSPYGVLTANPTRLEYTLVHEWGHMVDSVPLEAYEEEYASSPNFMREVSQYADRSNREGTAETFALEWFDPGNANLKQAFEREGWGDDSMARNKINNADRAVADLHRLQDKWHWIMSGSEIHSLFGTILDRARDAATSSIGVPDRRGDLRNSTQGTEYKKEGS